MALFLGLLRVLLLLFQFIPCVFSFQLISSKMIKSSLVPHFPRAMALSRRGALCGSCFPPLNSEGEIRPSLADNTRTITHICKSGILSTISDKGNPSGMSVDYVLDQKGHPIFFFSKSVTTLSSDVRASLFCKTPLEYGQSSSLSCKSASLEGKMIPVSDKEANSLKIAFSLTHPHFTDHLCNTEDVFFAKLQPQNILYSTGDFGTKHISIDVQEYERALPDILAPEVPTLLPRLNIAKQYELRLVCKHVLKIEGDPDTVTLQAIDKLGIDIRTIQGELWPFYTHPPFCRSCGTDCVVSAVNESDT